MKDSMFDATDVNIDWQPLLDRLLVEWPGKLVST